MKTKTVSIVVITAVALVVTLGIVSLVAAQPPTQGPISQGEVSVAAGTVATRISYQGRLVDASGPVSGTRDITFRLYANEGDAVANAIWSQTKSVPVVNGNFSTELDVNHDHFNGQALWLGLQVAGDSEMSPRHEILPVPYALSLVPGALVYGSELTSTLTISNTGAWYGGTTGIDYGDRFNYLNGVRVRASGVYSWIEGMGSYTYTYSLNLGVGVNTSGTIAGVYGRSSSGDGGYFLSDSGYGVYARGNVGVGSFVDANKTGIMGSSGPSGGGTQPGVGVYGYGLNVAGVEGESAYGYGVYAINGTSVVTQPTIKIVNREAGGDLIRGYGNTGWSSTVDEGTLVFRVTADGHVYGDYNFATPASDFAEMMATEKYSEGYEPGDVLVISDAEDRAVELSAEAYSSAVVGIFSTRPGFVGGADDVEGIPVALVGVVPCKVSAENGPIQRGDLLTTSDTPGHAMRVTDRSRAIGAILGKALAPLESGTGVIPVLVTLQ